MPDVWTRSLLRRDELRWGSRVPWLAALLAAGWSLLAGLALASLPALVLWIGGGADAPVSDPLRLGTAIWLAGHRVGLDVDGVPLQLAPGGLSVLIVLLIYRSARWAAHVAGVETPAEAAKVIGPATVGYALGGAVLAAASTSEQVVASPLAAAVSCTMVAIFATGLGVLRESGLTKPVFRRLPDWQRLAARGALIAVAWLLAIGAALVTTSALANSAAMVDVVDRLEPDVAGTAALALLGAALAVNATVWGAAFALGPGFAVGAGTTVSPGGVEAGLIPAVPVLAVLPGDDFGPEAWLVLVGPVAAGVLVGFAVRRFGPSFDRTRLVGTAAAAAALAAVTMAALAYLSGGSAGAGRLADIGPVPWQVALSTLLLVGVPAIVVAAVRRPSADSD